MTIENDFVKKLGQWKHKFIDNFSVRHYSQAGEGSVLSNYLDVKKRGYTLI